MLDDARRKETKSERVWKIIKEKYVHRRQKNSIKNKQYSKEYRTNQSNNVLKNIKENDMVKSAEMYVIY